MSRPALTFTAIEVRVSPGFPRGGPHLPALSPGINRLVYRTLATDGIERFYVREVIRR